MKLLILFIFISCSAPSNSCGDRELALQNFYLTNKKVLDELIFLDPIDMNDHQAIIYYTYQKLDEEKRRCE